MIYALVINQPRLLLIDRTNKHVPFYDKFRSRAGVKDASLPSLFYLTKDAPAELMRYIVLVAQACGANITGFPWAYINPKYDIVFASCMNAIPTHHQAPSLQTLAFPVPNLYWNETNMPRGLLSGIGTFPFLKRILDKIHQHPNLKEVLLVRNIHHFSNPWGPRINAVMKVHIPKHTCGFFGSVTADIEERLAKGDIFRWDFQPSRIFINAFTRQMTKMNTQFYPGTQLPIFTAVYNQYTKEYGLWGATTNKRLWEG